MEMSKLDNINILVNLILQQYFSDHRCLLIYSDNGFNYVGDLPSVQITTYGSTNSKLIFNYYGCQGIVILSQNPKQIFINFEKQIHENLERFNRRRYLIVTHNKNYFDNLSQIKFVSDFLLVIPQENEHFELKTHTYVGLTENDKFVLLDKWYPQNGSFLFNKNLYPDKLTNQFGRGLKMATFTYEPYSIVESKKKYHGSELMTAVEFSKKYNMTADVIPVKDYWGEIFPNGTGYGLLGALVQDQADLGFAALYTWEICYKFLELSKPLVRTGITCLVPAPKPAARWLTPLFSYSRYLWMCVIAVLLVSIIILSIILYFYNHKLKKMIAPTKKYLHYVKMSITVVIKPVLLQSLTHQELPYEFTSTFMTGLILILSLFLTSTYSSGLSSVMTLPRYEGAINTVQDFAQSGLSWGAPSDAWILSIQSDKDPNYVTIVNNFQILEEDELETLSKTDNFAFSLERLPFENFAIGNYIKQDVIGNYHLMQQDLYWEQCVIMLRKNSVLLPLLDLLVLRLFESGLISKWQTEAVEKFMDTEVQRVVRYLKSHKPEQEVVSLKWSHVEGAFAILIMGHIISLVIFLIELGVSKSKKRSHRLEYQN